MAPDSGTISPQQRRAAYMAWAAVCIIWGTSFLAIRIALESIPPALIGALRYMPAGIVLAAIVLARGERLPAWRNWSGLAGLGFLMIVLGNGGVIWGEQWVPSGIAAVMVATIPFWTNGIESLLPGGERFTRWLVAGLAVGLAGILLLLWPDLTADGVEGRRFLYGVIGIQIACIGWSLGSIYSRRHAREESAFAASAVQMLLGGLMMMLIATVRGEWGALTFTPRTAWAEIYLIVMGSIAGFTAYVYALKHLPLSTVSLYAFVNPIIAVAIGTWLANEPFGWRVVGASALVLTGIGITRLQGSGLRPQRPEPESSTRPVA